MEKQYLYSLKHRVKVTETAENGTMLLSALFRVLQDAAGSHSELLGTGKAFTQTAQLMWIVIRSSAEIIRMPRLNEEICIETWPSPPRHMLFPRSYFIYDGNGNRLVQAISVWALADTDQRAIVQSDYVSSLLSADNTPASFALPSKIKLPVMRELGKFSVPGNYIDENRHMNNTRYFDLAEKLYPELRSREFKAVTIEYINEARENDTISVFLSAGNSEIYLSGDTRQQCFKIRYII